MNKPTLSERLEKAVELRKCGRNCAQTVILSFSDITGLDDETAARITNALGTGVAACGEICGVANAMAIISGMRCDAQPTSKVAAVKIAKPLITQFADKTNGRLSCRDLKRKGDAISCELLIAEGIEILHNNFNE